MIHTLRMASLGGSCITRPAPIAGTPPYLPRILWRLVVNIWRLVIDGGEQGCRLPEKAPHQLNIE